MKKNSHLIMLLLAASLIATGCNDAGKTASAPATAVQEEGDEHDHAAHAEPAAAADEHEGHGHGAEPAAADGHDHEEHADEAMLVSLDLQQIRELGIASAPAGPGSLGRDLELTGEVGINEDEVTHVIPRTGGIVRRVYHSLGDRVTAGEPMLEIDSMELAEHKSLYLAVLSQIELLAGNLERERMLMEKGISAEQDYLAARQAHEEKLIEKRGMEQKLRALGVSDEQIARIASDPDASLTSYTIHAPASGEIIEKHVTRGEMVDTSTALFTIGDFSSLWVHLNVYPEDMADVRQGLQVLVDPGHGIEPVTGEIDYIEPIVGEATRTAVARVVLQRTDEVFRPGLFVTGHVEIGGGHADIVLPRNAVVELDEDHLVFVRKGTDFEPRVVTIGRTTASGTEILAGLEAGEEVVVEGAFQLKAELLKGTFDPHAGHAH